MMKNIKSFEQFMNESALQSKEIDITQFPNPVTSVIGKMFTTKGEADGEKNDDIVQTKPAAISASALKPSQDAIYLSKSLAMAIGGVEGGELGAIISADNYILDGHHRWAATMFNNPSAKIKGFQAKLGIGDLVPVLRALGDAFGNDRRGEPKGGDVNIFKATIKDVMDAILDGKNMDPKYYDKGKAEKWLEKSGGEAGVEKALKRIQATPPPADAPPRNQMPVIEPDKGEEKLAAELLNKGKVDVRAPYANA
jgi:hypothetical protein